MSDYQGNEYERVEYTPYGESWNRYGADGQRAVKYSSHGESLYFDSMWQAQTDYPSLRQSKHVYVGSKRVATRLNIQGQLDVGYETVNTYYYHPDHLGSSQLVSDYQGNEYERVEYTPYGESWIEKSADSRDLLPFKFTGKELDSETGLYYYGARYLNPRTSRWVGADPAMGDYLPLAPVSDEAKKHNGDVPGDGGVFASINLAIYHYAGDNPVKYIDPTGLDKLRLVFDGTNQTLTVYLDITSHSGATATIKMRTYDATNNPRPMENPAATAIATGENYYPQHFPSGTSAVTVSSIRTMRTRAHSNNNKRASIGRYLCAESNRCVGEKRYDNRLGLRDPWWRIHRISARRQ